MTSTLTKVLDRATAKFDLYRRGDMALARRVRTANLTYLNDDKLAKIAGRLRAIEALGIEGDFIEAGCALGGSTIFIASLMAPTRRLRTHDVFGMIPPPTEADPAEVHARYREITEGKSRGLGGDTYYGYVPDLKSVVRGNLERHLDPATAARVDLIEGLVQDTLHPEGAVAFAHVDVDWYEPVKVCIERIAPHLARGGVMVFDDYHDWGGCKRAVDEMFGARTDGFLMGRGRASMTVTRI